MSKPTPIGLKVSRNIWYTNWGIQICMLFNFDQYYVYACLYGFFQFPYRVPHYTGPWWKALVTSPESTCPLHIKVFFKATCLSCCPNSNQKFSSGQNFHFMLKVVVTPVTPSTRRTEEGGSWQMQGQSGLHSQFKARPCLKKQNKQELPFQ